MFRSYRTALLFAMSALTSARANAEDAPSARLEVSSPAESGCIDAPRLASQVEARLGRSAFSDEARLLLKVSLVPRGPRGWEARLELLNTRGERFGEREIVTESQACHELDSSLVLVTALLVDSPAATEAARSESAPPPENPAESLPPVTPSAPPEEPKRALVQQDPLWVETSLGAAVRVGHVPEPFFGGYLAFDVKPPGFIALGVEVNVHGAREIVDEAFEVSAEVRHASVGFYACPFSRGSALEVGVCLGQEIGYTHAESAGFDVNRQTTRLGTMTFGRLTLEVPMFFPLRLKAALTGGVPLVRDRYIFPGPDRQVHEFFRTGSVVAVGQFGVAARLP